MKAQASPPASDYPKKLYYKIREVAAIAGVRPHVLRYWESEFAELKPEKDGSDQRRYRQRDIDVVLAIRQLLYEDGFTIKGARGRLRAEVRLRRGEAAEPSAGEKEHAAPRAIGFRPGPGPRNGVGGPTGNGNGNGKSKSEAAIGRDLTLLRGEVNELLDLVRKTG